MMDGKVCTKCKVFKEYINFYKSKKGKNGYESRCKECSKSELNNYRKNNREKVRSKEREYYNKTKKKRLESHKKYREKNKDKIYAVSRKWYSENKDIVSENRKIWYQENKELMKERRRQWYLQNKDKAYLRVLKRRSLKHSVAFAGVKRKDLLDRDNWTCQICGVRVHDRNEGGNENRHLWDDERKAHLDHVIPISKGGDSTPQNMQVLCRTCNLSKSDKTDLSLNDDGQIEIEI